MVGIGIAIGALTACGASTGLPKESAHEVVAAENASGVLLRLVATTRDGKLINFSERVAIHGAGDFFVLAENIDTGTQMELSEPSLPPEAASEGWMFLVLAPGRYEVIVKPGLIGPASRRFFLAVPAAGAVIYGGSFAITCERTWAYTRCGPPSEATDESESAAKIAHAMPQGYGPLMTSLLR